MNMLCLGLRPALPRGRGDRAPPRKSPFASSPGFFPQGLSGRKALRQTQYCPPFGAFADPWGLASPRRGGLRTPAGMPCVPPGHVPSRPPGLRLPPMNMLCLGLRPAFPRGRAERVPPRKTPFASSPAFPRKASPPGLASPLGGAGSARPRGRHHALPGRFPFLKPRFSSWPTWAAEGRAPHARGLGLGLTQACPR
jgi:hypothetical protein